MRSITKIFDAFKVVVYNDSVKEAILADILEDYSTKSDSRSVIFFKQHSCKRPVFLRKFKVTVISLSDNTPAETCCQKHTVFVLKKHIVHYVLLPSLKDVLINATGKYYWITGLLIGLAAWFFEFAKEGGTL